MKFACWMKFHKEEVVRAIKQIHPYKISRGRVCMHFSLKSLAFYWGLCDSACFKVFNESLHVNAINMSHIALIAKISNPSSIIHF